MADILVIDDDADVREIVRRTLEGVGHTVRLAVDGARGLAEFRRATPDLTITDVFMPGVDGLETVMEIMKMKPDSRVLVISGGGERKNLAFMESAIEFGAAGSLAKPFSPAQLRDAVAALLELAGGA